MAGLLGRIFKQWFEQALVDKISNSKAMQNAASAAVKASQEATRFSEEASKDPTKVKQGVLSLLDALRSEIAKDLEKVGIKGGSGTIAEAGGERVVEATQASPPHTAAAPKDAYFSLSVKQLQAKLAEKGVSFQGLYEKHELVQALRESEKLR